MGPSSCQACRNRPREGASLGPGRSQAFLAACGHCGLWGPNPLFGAPRPPGARPPGAPGNRYPSREEALCALAGRCAWSRTGSSLGGSHQDTRPLCSFSSPTGSPFRKASHGYPLSQPSPEPQARPRAARLDYQSASSSLWVLGVGSASPGSQGRASPLLPPSVVVGSI